MTGLFEAASGIWLVLFTIVIATATGDYVAVRRQVDVRWILWGLAAAALFAARAAYIWRFHLAYLDAPWTLFDLRDGGWSAEGGFVGLWLVSIWMCRRRPALKWPIRAAAMSGTLLWSAGAAALAVHDAGSSVGRLPELTLSSRSGAPVELGALRGKPVVVNLWATWCPPCNREMPVLAQAQAAHPEVNFVFIDQGENLMDVGGWLSRHQLDLRNVMLDPHMRAGAALGQRAFPTTYFFDADGRLVDRRIGELSPALLADKLARITAAR